MFSQKIRNTPRCFRRSRFVSLRRSEKIVDVFSEDLSEDQKRYIDVFSEDQKRSLMFSQKIRTIIDVFSEDQKHSLTEKIVDVFSEDQQHP
jgi:Mg/Co/Ni transporter MgtE